MDKKSKYIVGSLVIMLVISIGVIIYLLISGNKTYENITGKVIVADKKYVIIEANNDDYLINNIKGNYTIGDEVKFSYEKHDLNSKASPKTIKISDEDLIKHEEVKEDNINNIDKEDNSTTNNNNSNSSNTNKDNNINKDTSNSNSGSSNNITNNTTSNDTNKDTTNSSVNTDKDTDTNADVAVINYFNTYEQDLKTSSVSNAKSTLKNGFVTVVDFLFYKGKIKGYTFEDLTTSAKLKVLAMALYFDNKIEEYFPGYKESISSTTNKIYTNLKEEIVSNYLILTTTVCENNSSLCESAKNTFSDIKKNFGLTWSLIKSIAGDGLTNLKNWYEIWRDS